MIDLKTAQDVSNPSAAFSLVALPKTQWSHNTCVHIGACEHLLTGTA